MNDHHIWRRFVSFVASLVALLLSTQAWAQLAEGQPKFLGNVIGQSVPSNFAQYWNQVTPENAGKWGSVEGTRNQMNWAQLDAAYDFAQQNGFKFKGHTLVWGSQYPSWMTSLSAAEQRAEIEQWIQLYAQRYPNTWAIDVVNEPIKTPLPFKAALGGDGVTGWDWVITSFQLARKYLPNAKLLINEYGTENDPPVRAQYINIINLLKARGLIDGIGVQAHYFNLDYMSASQMTATLNDYASTGLDVYISELDITGGGTEAGQAAKYQELFPVMWNHSSVKGITLWGYIVGQVWRDGTGLINSNGSKRQAMVWLENFFKTSPSFSISATPGSASVDRGATATASIAVTRTGGFTGSVSFSVSGLPTGVTATFTPPSTTGDSATLTFSASSTATLGTSNVTVTATSGTLSSTATIALTVGAGTQPDFSISAQPSSLTIKPGASGSAALEIARFGGFTGSVSLGASGLPSGVTATFSPASTTGNSSSLTLTASSSATVGSATVTITASSGTLSRTATLRLIVNADDGSGNVTITPVVASSNAWYNEQHIRISHTVPLTALTVTVVIQRTTGLSVAGQYNSVGSQINQTITSSASAFTYQFTLAPGQTLNPGVDRLFAAQTRGSGAEHPTSGDTYTITYTTGGQTFTRSGTF